MLAELVQSLREQLQAQTDPEHGLAAAPHVVVERLTPAALAQARGRRAGRPHARQDDALGVGEVLGAGGDVGVAAGAPDGALHRREIARPVVDDANGGHGVLLPHGARLPASTAWRQRSKSHGALFGRARHAEQSGI